MLSCCSKSKVWHSVWFQQFRLQVHLLLRLQNTTFWLFLLWMQHFCSEMVVSAKSVVNPTASDVGWRIQTCCETERDVGHQRVDLSLKHLPNMLLCGHGRHKGGQRGQDPLEFENFSKKRSFSYFRVVKKRISPLLAPLRKIWKNHLVPSSLEKILPTPMCVVP